MADKEFRRLKRSQLIDIIYHHTKNHCRENSEKAVKIPVGRKCKKYEKSN